jgi:DNA-binding transcriptional LysR family regulator
MLTLKQIETLHWIVELGTFERAAARLNTTQSALSKRIRELEAATGLTLFDRSARSVRLTEKGDALLALGREMLALQQRIATLQSDAGLPARRLRLGVTELTALTWLPRLVTELRAAYPDTELQPEVDLSSHLFERLLEDTVDIVVIPEAFADPRITVLRLAEVQNAWMASPDLVRSSRTLTLQELGHQTILTQGSDSGSGRYFDRWLRSEGAAFPRVLSANSLIATVGLTLAGIGVSYLPLQCFQPLVDEGKLRIVPTRPLLPPVPYAAMVRSDRRSAFTESVAQLIQKTCNFSTQYQR